MKGKLLFTLVVIGLSVTACGVGGTGTATATLPPYLTATPGAAGATATPVGLPGTTQPTAAPPETVTPAATMAPSDTAVPPGTMSPPGTTQPTVAVPTAAATSLPTATAGPLPSGDLTTDQMSTILSGSLADFPWRMGFDSTDSTTGRTISGTVTANSTSRMEVTVQEPLNGVPVTVDLIVITPTMYVKVNGVPSSVLGAAGLQEGQWSQIAAGQDVLGLSSIATAAANPDSMLLGLGFQGLLSPSSGDQTPFKLTGTETVAGVATNVYERQTSGTAGTTTYRVNVGTADSRVYQMQAQGPVEATVTMAYDPSIDVQAPIP